MAELTEQEIAQLQKHISIVFLAKNNGVTLKRRGNDFIGNCPFHKDSNQDLHIDPEQNLWQCLGVCHISGGVLEWLMAEKSISRHHATYLLKTYLSNNATTINTATFYSALEIPSLRLAATSDDLVLLHQIVNYYHCSLKNSPEVLDYLYKQGLTDPTAIDTFKLGYANRTLTYALPHPKSKSNAIIRGQLQRVGILRPTGHEHFNGSLIAPFWNMNNQLVQIYGRKITRGLRKGTPVHLYLPKPLQGIWNVSALAKNDEIILCQSLFDALTFWSHGYRNVTAYFTPDFLQSAIFNPLLRYRIKRLLIASAKCKSEYNASTTLMLARSMSHLGIECYCIDIPRKHDFTGFARNCTNPNKSSKMPIHEAKRLELSCKTNHPSYMPGQPTIEASEREMRSTDLRSNEANHIDYLPIGPSRLSPTSLQNVQSVESITRALSNSTSATPMYKQSIESAKNTVDCSLKNHLHHFLTWSEIHGYSPYTIKTRLLCINHFICWCGHKKLVSPNDVTRSVLIQYQRHLYDHRKSNGKPLCVTTQRSRLSPIKAFFKWLILENLILHNPAADLILPRIPKRLPRHILTANEIEAVLAHTQVHGHYGVRDRAILETFYSTGIRRMELINLSISDVDLENGTLMVREGKGKRDRFIPIGERACKWIRTYLDLVRPKLVIEPDTETLFLTNYGKPFIHNRLSDRVRKYLDAAGITKPGACHLFRHAMATQMLENGADIRYIQMMLGHANLSTTEIYTKISIKKLKEVHSKTHPAKLV